MNTKKILASIVSSAISATLLLGPVITEAVSVNAVTSATTPVAGLKVQANMATRLSKIIVRSDTAIAARITDLNKLNARIQSMRNVSAAEKTNITNEVQANIGGLNSLKAKIDADTDVNVATTDEKSIRGSYRIYALVIPQGYIMASADRVNTIINLITTMSEKLQARISAEQSAGKDVSSLQTSLINLNAKIADAKVQENIAQNGVVSLTPDQGNKAKLASNTAALKAARANIKIATSDLQIARQNVKSILQGLKNLNIKASVNASTSADTSR